MLDKELLFTALIVCACQYLIIVTLNSINTICQSIIVQNLLMHLYGII